MSLSNTTPRDTNARNSRKLWLGDIQILDYEGLAQCEERARRQGYYVDARPVVAGVDDVFAVRTFATADDFEQFSSLLYLGLPPV